MTDKSARETIAEWLVDIGDGPADEEVAARMLLERLAERGLKVVGLKPSKAALRVGAQALIDTQPHNGVPQLAVFPAYEVWWAMVRAYDAAASNPKEEGK